MPKIHFLNIELIKSIMEERGAKRARFGGVYGV